MLALLQFPIPGLFSPQQRLATYLFLCAKQVIAKAWNEPSVSFQEAKYCMTTMMIDEKTSSIVYDSQPKLF